MTATATAAFEAEHVHAVYDEIAADFSRTRHSPWPFVRHFLDSLPPASLVLDAGTGNGKYLGTRSVLDYSGKHDPPPTRRGRAHPESESTAPTNGDMLAIGFDRSHGLLSIASDRGHEVVRGDCVDLSCWRRGAFDHAISIATIHHFATPERRIEAIKQMILAVLPPTPPPSNSPNNRPRSSSRILVVVWSLEQDPALVADDRSARRTRGGKQGAVPAPPLLAPGTTSDSKVPKKLEAEGANAVVQDVFVPWARQNQIPRLQKATSTGGAVSSSSSSAKKQPSVSKPKPIKREQSPSSSSPSSSKGEALQKVPSSATGAATEWSQKQPEIKPEAAAAAAAATPTAPAPAPAPAPAKAEGNSSEAATPATDTETPAPTFNRYYHLFRHYELSSLVQSAASQLGLAFSHPEGYPLPSNPSEPLSGSKPTSEGKEGWEATVRLCEERWERENWVVEVEVGWCESGSGSERFALTHAGAAIAPGVSQSAE